MNRILFSEQADFYEMDPKDPRFEHVRGVLRMKKGDSFDVGAFNGPVGKATICSLDRQKMRIEVVWGDVPPLPPPVYLVVGMCRPATARKILSVAPTLGVRGVHFLHCGRSDPAYAKASLWRGEEWNSVLIKGVEQAFDTHVPNVSLCRNWQALWEVLPEHYKHMVALDVYEGTQPLSDVRFRPGDSVVLAIGPERGWNRQDRKELLEHGFKMVSLSDRVLKVETAVVVGLTFVLAGLGVY